MLRGYKYGKKMGGKARGCAELVKRDDELEGEDASMTAVEGGTSIGIYIVDSQRIC